MPEYLPETKSESGWLIPKEHLDILFKVKNAGTITIFASAQPGGEGPFPWPIDPTGRRVELFNPGSSTPVDSRTDSGYLTTTILQYNATDSEAGSTEDWTARVTNLEDTMERFYVRVSYPGDIPIEETFTVPTSIVETFVNATIGQTRIHVTSGANASLIDFPEELGVPDVRFTVPDFDRRINMPWPVPDIRIRERVNDINSSDVAFSLENATTGFSRGFMRFVVRFEEAGREILGTFRGEMSNMRLTIDLGLEVRDRKISYDRNNVRVSFSFRLRPIGIPDSLDSLADAIFGYRDEIRRTVENTVRSIFQDEAMRQAFSDAITAQVSPLLGDNPRIVSASIEGNQLTIRYYNA